MWTWIAVVAVVGFLTTFVGYGVGRRSRDREVSYLESLKNGYREAVQELRDQLPRPTYRVIVLLPNTSDEFSGITDVATHRGGLKLMRGEELVAFFSSFDSYAKFPE